MARHIAFALAFLVQVSPAMAVAPPALLAAPVLEARARDISKGLRCVVCRNQDIDGSNAGIARDMRLVLRERIMEGDSNEEAIQYIVDRYGTYVLLRPPVGPSTSVLWAGPGLLLALTGFGFSRRFRSRRSPDPIPPLDENERAKIDQLLNQMETK